MAYRLLYSEASREQIRSLHPQIKPTVKSHIKTLKDNPYVGKVLERELSGYYSLKKEKVSGYL